MNWVERSDTLGRQWPLVAWLDRWQPLLDVGLALLAACLWLVRPQLGLWPLMLIAVAWASRLVAYGYLTRTTPFDAPLALFLLSAFASTLIAYNQGSEWIQADVKVTWAWAKFWQIVAAIALFYALANLRDLNQVWGWLRVSVLLGVAVAVYFVLTHDWRDATVKFSLINQIGASLTAALPPLPWPELQPNIAAGIIAMLAPYGAVLWLAARARGQAREVIGWSVLLLIALFGLLLTASRAAWVALVVTLTMWTALHPLAMWLNHASKRWPRALTLLVVAGIIVSILSTMLSLAILSLTAAPATFLGANVAGGELSRLDVFRGALPLAQDYFFTGAGLASFPLLYSVYYLLLPVVFLPNSHNLFLDILIEQGIGGLLSYAWLLGACLWVSLRALRYLLTRPERAQPFAARLRWLLEAALASMAIALGHGMVEDVPYASMALPLLFVPLALAVAAQKYFPSPKWTLSIWVAVVGAALLALALLWQRPLLLSSLQANLGALTQTQRELGQYHWPDRLPEQVRRDGDLSDAINAFNRARDFNTDNRTANQRLSMIALERGAYDSALHYAQLAYVEDPGNLTTMQLLGDAYLAVGRLDDAFQYWSRLSDAESRLEIEAWARYEVYGDNARAQWAKVLAERIRATRHSQP